MSNDNSMLGLAQGEVRLSEPTLCWQELFEDEAEVLALALAEFHGVLEHCGSTSIPGIPAKPILDMLVGAPEPLDIKTIRSALEAVGYEHATWAGVPGHEVFGKGDPRTHLIHVVPHAGDAWDRMLRFRDTLRSNPILATEYGTLKRVLAARHPNDRATYTDGKAEFVRRVLG